MVCCAIITSPLRMTCKSLPRRPDACSVASSARLCWRHHLLSPAPHFLGRDILDMSGEMPMVAERIAHGAAAVAVELAFERLHNFGPCGDRARKDGVHVRNIEIQYD